MIPVFDFIIKPFGERYNNSVKFGDHELILNTEVFNHQHVNRIGVIHKTPLYNPLGLNKGDKVIVHHNVFRRWHNVKGIEKNSRSFMNEDEYLVSQDQIYMYKDAEWNAMPGYTFLKPIKAKDKYSLTPERPLVGVVKYSDGRFLPTQLVGFSPDDEYEFIVDGERLYRVMNKYINIEYEYQGDEEEYNPSWAESSRRVN
tara:strand:- start:121 stop:720 length:600 start_codon:yes stop_codon:yes gene_type:complete